MEEVSVLKIRIRFRKDGAMKFIGHLDMMRFFQKAVRRAEIPICYSEGYSPHQIMSFASPLGVGVTSEGEYMDIEVSKEMKSTEAMERLNREMVPGVEILSYKKLPDQAKNAMSVVALADYEIFFKEEYELPASIDTLKKILLEDFFSSDSFMVTKKTKKSDRIIDLRECVLEIRIHTENNNERPVIFMRLSAGSEKNIKPEFVLNACLEKAGITLNSYSIQIHRLDLYAAVEDHYQSLDEMGENIA